MKASAHAMLAPPVRAVASHGLYRDGVGASVPLARRYELSFGTLLALGDVGDARATGFVCAAFDAVADAMRPHRPRAPIEAVRLLHRTIQPFAAGEGIGIDVVGAPAWGGACALLLPHWNVWGLAAWGRTRIWRRTAGGRIDCVAGLPAAAQRDDPGVSLPGISGGEAMLLLHAGDQLLLASGAACALRQELIGLVLRRGTHPARAAPKLLHVALEQGGQSGGVLVACHGGEAPRRSAASEPAAVVPLR